MNDKDLRELVRIRLELRRLVGGSGARQEAPPLLDRMGALASRDVGGDRMIQPELQRWRALLRLDG
jgi:hypothetical protein